MPENVTITGSCHCANIRYRLLWPAGASAVATRACSCTFCRKHGASWTSHTDARLEIDVDVSERTLGYRFGTATADFLICTLCGVPPVVLSEIDGCTYAVVNVNTFDASHGLEFSETATNFDAEDEAARLERRQRNWIPEVRFDSDQRR